MEKIESIAGVGSKNKNPMDIVSGGINPDELMDIPFGKIHPVLDQDLLGRSCPCCGSPNLNKDRLSYVCFRCGTTIPIGVEKYD